MTGPGAESWECGLGGILFKFGDRVEDYSSRDG